MNSTVLNEKVARITVSNEKVVNSTFLNKGCQTGQFLNESGKVDFLNEKEASSPALKKWKSTEDDSFR